MLGRTKGSVSSLAPAEQRVVKLVLDDPRAFAILSITVVATRSHISKPTVARFCRSMGHDGLGDFELKLAGSVSEEIPNIHRTVDADNKTSDVLTKICDNAVAAFVRYRNEARSQAIAKTTDV